jgi:NRAMP (natural resistance-associated macrophage protein)-like metal ion transporter
VAAGLSSTVVGTLAGQVVMQGFIRFHIPLWFRRAVTMLPSFIVILMGLDPTRILVMSQVLLSFGIALALVPLLIFHQQFAADGRPGQYPVGETAGVGDCRVVVRLTAG